MNTKKNIVLKMNNTAANSPCGICGGRSDDVIGLEMFVEGAWDSFVGTLPIGNQVAITESEVEAIKANTETVITFDFRGCDQTDKIGIQKRI